MVHISTKALRPGGALPCRVLVLFPQKRPFYQHCVRVVYRPAGFSFCAETLFLVDLLCALPEALQETLDPVRPRDVGPWWVEARSADVPPPPF